MPLPVVPLVGRVNVGKSSLFNRLVGRRVSIEDPTPGVTRDRVGAVCELAGKTVELVDTGGMGQTGDPLVEAVEAQATQAVTQAALVLLVVDARAGCLPLDIECAQRLREAGRPTLLVVNKVDTPRQEPLTGEFAKMGFSDIAAVSATTGQGVADLVRRIAAGVPAVRPEAIPARRIRIAVVGRPNVGKSTWVNAFLREPRMITSDAPGTTRDAVDVTIVRQNRAFTLVDTAGLRKTRAVQDSIDFYAQARALQAVEGADAVLFLVDAREEVSRVDRRLAGEVVKLAKPVVLGVNKWDLVPSEKQESFMRYIEDRFPELSGSPVVFTSGLAQISVNETMELVWELGRRALVWWDPAALSRAVERAVERQPPGARRHGRRPAVNGVRQVGVNPIRIQIHTNDPALWRPADLWMLARAIRKEKGNPWGEIPILVKPVGAKGPRSKKHR